MPPPILRPLRPAVAALAALAVAASVPPLAAADDGDDRPRAESPPVLETIQLSDARRGALSSVADGLETARRGGLASPRAPDPHLDYEEILDEDRSPTGSTSTGTIREGSVQNAVRLAPSGPHHEIIETHRSRNTHWGTAELVESIEHAARHVADHHGGAPLRVGNLGFRHGGPIPWSSSHQAGRDADLAFYALDDQGRSVPTPGLVEFDDEGRALDRDLYFDVPRNWTLVRALLTAPDINVQWLFVSLGLKELMLEHAAEIGEPRPLIERAAEILHQPTDAPPHADHLHLRIGCAETDRLEGCVDWGPRWEWYDWHDDALFARTRQLDRALRDEDPDLRARALEFLEDIRAPFGPELALQHGLDDPDSEVRSAAFDVLDERHIDSVFGVRVLARRLEQRDALTTDRLETLYAALGRADAPGAAELAVDRLLDDSLSDDERHLALRALRHRMKPRIVPDLAELVRTESNADLRERAAAQIRRISARSHDLDWSKPLTDDHRSALQDWERWAQSPETDRRDVLLEMLEPHGVDRWEQLRAVDDLIPLLRTDDDYKRYNLNLVLSEWTGRWVPRDLAEDRRAYDFWSNWWERNRARQLGDRTPSRE